MYKHHKILNLFFILILSGFSVFAYTPQYADSKGKQPLSWNEKTIKIEISQSLLTNRSNLKSEEEIFDVILKSLKPWRDAADIDFQLEITDKENVSPAGSFGDGVSLITIAQTPQNILLFGEKANDVSAITRVFFDRSGNITEADIVLNPIQYFSTDGTLGTFDLEATLTHEVGHLLGLGHSKVIGSTMHSHQGKNGIYNLPGFTSRTLSKDDIAGIIFLYGKKDSNIRCCGTIEGQITASFQDKKTQFHIWAEEKSSGRIFAGVSSDNEGRFSLAGLEEGLFQIYAQPLRGKKLFSTVSLGSFKVEQDKEIYISEKINLNPKDFTIQYIGFNGQLSTLAVPLNKGKSFLLYVGGKGFNHKDFEISLNSPFFEIKSGSIKEHNYGNGLSVLSFEVIVDPEAKFGEYSIKLTNRRNKIAYLVGGLTIGRLANSWVL